MGRLSFLTLVWGLALAIPLVGCGEGNPLDRKAVSGTVTFDGQPLDNGSIEFHPLVAGGVPSGGPISGGSYSLPAEEGLPVGKYRVQITAQEPTPPLPAGYMPGDDLPFAPPKELIPPDWNKDSQHEIEVKADGPFVFDFAIETTES